MSYNSLWGDTMMYIPEIIVKISHVLHKQNAKAIVVGGSVRDHFLQLPSKDYDVEVYGLERIEVLEALLSNFGSVNLVGKSFGVLKFSHDGEVYDFSFPRLESKVAQGHRGFAVEVDGNLDFETAAKRRDFRINALGYDVEERRFLDPFNGLNDIKEKKLRHIDEETFLEDPLRVYRAVQFAARFDYVLADETFALCKKMVEHGMLEELPKERVYEEWKKLLLKSEKPSQGFELMKTLGILQYFPELVVLSSVEQSPQWHPEGDVWIHTMMSVDAMVTLLSHTMDEKFKIKMLFAILCHDLGKALTTSVDEEGRVRAIGHEVAGVEPTKSLLYRLTEEHDFIQSVLPFVAHHLKPSQFFAGKAKASAIRRLATKVNIEALVLVAKADFLGRTTKAAALGVYEAGDWLLEKAKALHVSEKPLECLVQGRDLIVLGLRPSAQFKEILDAVYSLQLEGTITTKDEAICFIKNKYI